jgi:outer membrane protein OmpA-like peptidoglycan-associated protein
MKAPFVALAIAAALVLRAGAAQSQEPNIDVQRFTPAVTHDGFVMVEGSDVRPEQDRWDLGVFLNYGFRPLVVADDDNTVVTNFVEHRLAFDVMGSVTVVGPFAIGLGIPFFVPQIGDLDPDVAGLGDIRVVPKVRILDDREAVGLGVIVELRPPTHVGDFAGPGGNDGRMLVAWPKFLIDHRFWGTGFRIGGNAGVLIKEGPAATQFLNINAGSEFTYSFAMAYRFGGEDGIAALGAEFDGAVGFREQDPEELPLEGLLFGQIFPNEEWKITFGPGFGLVEGYGEPTARVFAGFHWDPTSHDRDHDGISDDDDQCPDVAEDKDGDRDTDGCPEEDPDSDVDGIPDSDDECPDQKETINGIEDEDGCPDDGKVKVIRRGGKIEILETVEFQVNSAQIQPRSHSLLNQVALTIKANPDIEQLRIEGHTDDTGPRDNNVKLSKARAESVRRYLIGRGVNPQRLNAKGFGPDKPIIDEKTPEARAKNRRVEFVVEQ